MKLAMYDLEGHFLEVLEGNTYQEIIDLLPVKSGIKNAASIQQVVSGERNFAGSYQFRKVISQNPLIKIGSCIDLRKSSEKKVHKYYKGNYICTYTSIQEAADINNIQHTNIVKCAKEERGTAGGFQWHYTKNLDL
jgi:hypothetical protein